MEVPQGLFDFAAAEAGVRFERGIATFRHRPVSDLIALSQVGFDARQLAAYVSPIAPVPPESIDKVLAWARARGLVG